MLLRALASQVYYSSPRNLTSKDCKIMSSNNTSANTSSGNDSNSSNNTTTSAQEPTVVSGWEHSRYAHSSDRYAYIGKEGGEPQWVDWGPKGGR